MFSFGLILLLLGLLNQFAIANPGPVLANEFSTLATNPTLVPTDRPSQISTASTITIGVYGNVTSATCVALDSSGNAIAGGFTTGQLGATPNLGIKDFFIQSYSSTGGLQLAIQFGTTLNDELYGVSTDASGNIYTTGMCGLPDDNAAQTRTTFYGTTTNGGGDLCYAVFNPSGTKLLSGVFGGASNDAGTSIAVRGSSFYIAGWSMNNDGTAPSTNPGFVLEFDIASGIQIAHYQPAVTQPGNYIVSMAIDSLGNMWTLSGYWISSTLPQAFLINKISPDFQSLLWINEVPSAEATTNKMLGTSIAVDDSNNVYAVGSTSYANGYENILVYKYDNAGNKQWTALVGGSGHDCGFVKPLNSYQGKMEILLILDMNTGACKNVKYIVSSHTGYGQAVAANKNMLALAGYVMLSSNNPYVTSKVATLNLLDVGNLAPTGSVTAAPSFVATVQPSRVPTVPPSTVPTTSPTASPSTLAPTARPTTVPTIVPSTTSTTCPTTIPSVRPSTVPTCAPSAQPTALPTNDPNCVPTVLPTVVPTATPTSAAPSAVPSTAVPSTKPTTSKPSRLPTIQPTAVPTAYVIPWVQTSAPAYLWAAIASDASGQYLVTCERTTSGIWTSSDYGNNWVRRFSLVDSSSYAVSSDSSGQNLVAGMQSGDAYFSRDYGITWTLSDAPNYNWYALTSSASGQHVLMNSYSSPSQLYISHNYGQNWTATSAPAGFWTCVASSASGQYLVAGMYYNGIYASKDYGETWVKKFTGLWDNPYPLLWWSIASDATGKYIVASDNSFVYTSNDFGWTFVKRVEGHRVCSDSSGANLAAFSPVVNFLSNVLVSGDYGATWVVSDSTMSSWGKVASDASGKRLVAVNNYYGIYTYYNTFIDPSASPTTVPTRSPGEPTETPTITPSSHGPTIVPTVPPIRAPTRVPSVKPSASPTQPSAAPTRAPSQPTTKPTAQPTALPTRAPTTKPSNPSAAPTLRPTAVPTAYVIPWVKSSAPAYLWEAIASDASGQYLVASERTTLGIWTSTDYGDNWVRRFTLSNDGAHALSSDASGQNLVASGIEMYAYFSRDYGITWTLSDSPSASWLGLASDASGQQVIMNSYGEAGLMYISHNFGQNWTLTSAPAGRWACAASSASGQYLIAGMDFFGVYSSHDYGATWAKAPSTVNRNWFTLASDATGQFVAGGAYTFFTSNDYGVTFTEHRALSVNYVCSDSSGANLATNPLIYSDDENILLSSDYGETWAVSAAPHTTWRKMASDASGKRLVAIAYLYLPGIWTYHNNFTSPSISPTLIPTRTPGAPTECPTIMPSSRAPTNVPFSAKPTTAPVGSPTPTCAPSLEPTKSSLSPNSEPTAIPTDHLVPWVQTSAPASNWQEVASDATGQYLVAAELTTSGIWTSTDYGATWAMRLVVVPKNSLGGISSDSSGQNLVVGVVSGGAYFSRDYGITWRNATIPLGGWNAVACDVSGQHVIMSAYSFNKKGGGPIYISHDYGQNWEPTSAPSRWWFSVASSASGQYLVAVGDGVYTSQDFGVTWVRTPGPYLGPLLSVASDTTGQYLVAATNKNLYTSSDYGATFALRRATGSFCVCSDSSGANLAAVNGYGGANQSYSSQIILSSDYGATWMVSASPLTNWRALACDYSGKRLVAVATGDKSGVWTFDDTIFRSPSTNPTSIRTETPTIIDTVKPTVSPSVQPSASSTRFHTMNPTVSPTVQPVVHPSQAPTAQPLVLPSCAPTTTIVPTILLTAVPSVQPTAPRSPIVSFTSNITLSRLVTPTLDAASQSTVVETTASQMGVPVSTVSYVTIIALPTGVAPATHLRNGARHVQTTYAVIAVTETQVALDQTSYTTPVDLYSGLTTNLVNSVKSGAYSAALVSNAQAMGATDLYSATATAVIFSEPTVTAAVLPTEKTLGVGAFVSMAFFGAVLLALWVWLCVYFRRQTVLAPAHVAGQGKEVNTINEGPKLYSPLHTATDDDH
eukprot:gene9957-11673_t